MRKLSCKECGAPLTRIQELSWSREVQFDLEGQEIPNTTQEFQDGEVLFTHWVCSSDDESLAHETLGDDEIVILNPHGGLCIAEKGDSLWTLV